MNAWFGRVGTEHALPEKMFSLWLVTNESHPETIVKHIADGCEEEGIPLSWYVKSGSANELAYFASLRSQLEIGIGLDDTGCAAIAIVNLPDRPYIVAEANTPQQLRWIGKAAARIAKNEPIPYTKSGRVLVGSEEGASCGETDEVKELVDMAVALNRKISDDTRR